MNQSPMRRRTFLSVPIIAAAVGDASAAADSPSFLPLGRRLQAGPGKRSPLSGKWADSGQHYGVGETDSGCRSTFRPRHVGPGGFLIYTRMTPNMPLSSGDKLGPYEILSAIGAGGMGEVYRAKDTKLGRQVAIKQMPGHLAANPSARERLRREASAAAALDHPFICKVFEIGEERGELFLVMEFISGD